MSLLVAVHRPLGYQICSWPATLYPNQEPRSTSHPFQSAWTIGPTYPSTRLMTNWQYICITHTGSNGKMQCLSIWRWHPKQSWRLMNWISHQNDLPLVECHETTKALAWQQQCSDLWVIATYNQELKEHLQNQGIYQWVEHLFSQVQDKHLPLRLQREYKYLINKIAELRMVVERLCHKYWMGQVLWCPLLAKSTSCIWYWKEILAGQQDCCIGTGVLRRHAKKLGSATTNKMWPHQVSLRWKSVSPFICITRWKKILQGMIHELLSWWKPRQVQQVVKKQIWLQIQATEKYTLLCNR